MSKMKPKVLAFKGNEVTAYDAGDGKVWFTSADLAEMLGYATSTAVSNIYRRNKDEFTEGMSRIVTVTISGNINGLASKKTRVFSARGAHLVGMLAETKQAKTLRRWLLDLIELEIDRQNDENLTIPEIQNKAVIELQNEISRQDKRSFEKFGQEGSRKMLVRKRHIKMIKIATQQITEFSQMVIPDLGQAKDEPDTEPELIPADE